MSSVEEDHGANQNSNGHPFPPVQSRYLAIRTINAADWPGPASPGGLEGKQGSPSELPEIIRLILEGPTAWTRIPAWVEPLGEEWIDKIEIWERHDGVYYTLSQIGADYIGVYMVELTPRQVKVAEEFGIPASDDEPTLCRWAWKGDRGPQPRVEPEWADKRIQPKLVDMDCVLPKCIRWAPECVRAVHEAKRREQEEREHEGNGRPTRMEKLAGEIRKVNGVADRRREA